MKTANDCASPLDVVCACRAADLAILEIAFQNILRFVPCRNFYIFTARGNFERFQQRLGLEVNLIDEDEAIPGMTLEGLRGLNLPRFPSGAGWYFQQLLKYCFCYRFPKDDYYLIWDADTVPLQSLEFFDTEGRMVFTIADELHEPYFQTYRKLLQEEPHRKFSFISQHMIVQKSILREMLARIEDNCSGDESWAWKIMRNLGGEGTNRFSEYETFGHYLKNHYPERAAYRQLEWLREGFQKVKRIPRPSDLEELGRLYYFAAFEAKDHGLRRAVQKLRHWRKKN